MYISLLVYVGVLSSMNIEVEYSSISTLIVEALNVGIEHLLKEIIGSF